MDGKVLEDIVKSPEQIIGTEKGDVLRVMKSEDIGFNGFGEAYFSFILPGAVKAWKRHTQMTMNIVVPIGMVRFVFVSSSDGLKFREENIGVDNYCRLTVPPGIWFGFQGMSKHPSLVLNVANLPHNPKEAESKLHDSMPFDWSM